jgi:hypothetical protein
MTDKATANLLAACAATAFATAGVLLYVVLSSAALTENLMSGDYPPGAGGPIQVMTVLSVVLAVTAFGLWVMAAFKRVTMFVGVLGLCSALPLLFFGVGAFLACAIAFS